MAELVGTTGGKVLWVNRLHVFLFFYVCVRVAASCSRGNEECTHLHLINDKGASNV